MARIAPAALAHCLTATALLATATTARADADSLFTLGVGAGLGLHAEHALGASADTRFVNQADLRLELLGFLGVDFSYDLGHDQALTVPADGLQYAAKMRLSALVYPYSGRYFAAYLAGGLGATSFAQLASLDGPGVSYQAGLGIEVRPWSHLAIDLSFMLLAPSAGSVEHAVTSRLEAAMSASDPAALATVGAGRTPNLGDLVSLKNHEVMLRLFLYL